jgi:pyruvate/2-oxoglutarate dehydrogenase complex dihydrolipoamide acyltransferase (E2) component
MSEGGIASWKVKEGDSFSAGDVLLEIETDKATIDVEAQDDGVLGKILISEGSKHVLVGKTIAFLAEEGDDITNIEEPQDVLPAPGEGPSPPAIQKTPPATSTSAHHPTSPPEPRSHALPTHSRPLFPSVQRLLLEHNIDKPDRILGTGVRGMLTKGDVLAYLGKASSPTGTFKQTVKDQQGGSQSTTNEDTRPLDGSSLRQLIVSSMLKSSRKGKTSVPDIVDFNSIIADYLPTKITESSGSPQASKNYFEGLL